MPTCASRRLRAAIRLIARTTAPVINDPRAVMKTGRIDNAIRLGDVPGVATPRTIAMAREILAGPTARVRWRTRDLRFRCCCALPAIIPGAISIWWSRRRNLSAAARRSSRR